MTSRATKSDDKVVLVCEKRNENEAPWVITAVFKNDKLWVESVTEKIEHFVRPGDIIEGIRCYDERGPPKDETNGYNMAHILQSRKCTQVDITVRRGEAIQDESCGFCEAKVRLNGDGTPMFRCA